MAFKKFRCYSAGSAGANEGPGLHDINKYFYLLFSLGNDKLFAKVDSKIGRKFHGPPLLLASQVCNIFSWMETRLNFFFHLEPLALEYYWPNVQFLQSLLRIHAYLWRFLYLLFGANMNWMPWMQLLLRQNQIWYNPILLLSSFWWNVLYTIELLFTIIHRGLCKLSRYLSNYKRCVFFYDNCPW